MIGYVQVKVVKLSIGLIRKVLIIVRVNLIGE